MVWSRTSRAPRFASHAACSVPDRGRAVVRLRRSSRVGYLGSEERQRAVHRGFVRSCRLVGRARPQASLGDAGIRRRPVVGRFPDGWSFRKPVLRLAPCDGWGRYPRRGEFALARPSNLRRRYHVVPDERQPRLRTTWVLARAGALLNEQLQLTMRDPLCYPDMSGDRCVGRER